MDAIVESLADQQAELADLLDGLTESSWHAPTRCEGWNVSDVVLHLAQTNELALGSATGRFAKSRLWRTKWVSPSGTTFTGAPTRAYNTTSPTPVS